MLVNQPPTAQRVIGARVRAKGTGSMRKSQITPQDWEVLRAKIQRLYNEEGRTFKEVAIILQNEHNFKPTKKQFDYKISKWKLHKYTTSNSERRGLIERVGVGELDAKGRAGVVKLTPAKLKRWGREVQGGTNLMGTHPRKVHDQMRYSSSTIETMTRHPPRKQIHGHCDVGERLAPLSQTVDIDSVPPTLKTMSLDAVSPKNLSDGSSLGHSDTPRDTIDFERESPSLWDCARIIDSPTLTTLLLAIDVDDMQPLPSPVLLEPGVPYISMKDLEGNRHEHSNTLKRTGEDEAHEVTLFITLGGQNTFSNREKDSREMLVLDQPGWPVSPVLTKEVNPFPESDVVIKAHYTSNIVPMSQTALNIQIEACQNHLVRLQSTLSAESPQNTGIMLQLERLARLYYRNANYHEAVRLFSSVMWNKKSRLGPNHPETITSYLDIIQSKLYQKLAKSEVEDLHGQNHDQIVKVFGATSEVGLRSRALMAKIKRYLERREETEILLRQVVQIALNKYGVNHDQTIRYMRDLAKNIIATSSTKKSKELLISGEGLVRRLIYVDRTVFQASKFNMAIHYWTLGRILQIEERYEESIAVFREGLQERKAVYGIDHPRTLNRTMDLASSLRKTGRYVECERLSRLCCLLIIRSPVFQKSLSNEFLIKIMNQLMLSLEDMGNIEEASKRAEELYWIFFRKHGEYHQKTIQATERLRSYYSELGLYQHEDIFGQRQRAIREMNAFTRLHLENGLDQPGQLEYEINHLIRWYESWLDEDMETCK
ncbi:hypothetical protein B0O99DRAFT_601131 [Bisporella sp. PMI_857]|nr:hypothetical protein B0O99DRAFT_601131 [Bisporella sp. PMI_857]